MLVTGPHQLLSSILTGLLYEGKESDIIKERKLMRSDMIVLFDFGAKIKIVVEMVKGKPKILFKMRFREGYNIHSESVDYLRSLYGSAITILQTEDPQSMILSVAVNDAVRRFQSPQRCIDSIAQIRIQTAGAPIFKALDRLSKGCSGNGTQEDFLYKLGSHGNCGTYHCISNKEK